VTDDLGLESIGLAVADPPEPLEVGEDLRVAGHYWLFVTGDANGRALLTHMGKYQARIAADVICGREDARIRGGLPPRVTFTEPQVAAVGHTLDSAQKAGLRVRAVDVSTQGTAGGSFVGKGVEGTSRIVVDEDRRVIVGATFVGAEVAEWLHAATIAVVAEVPLDDLWHAVPAFPTRSEVWLDLLQSYGL
jgi:pyruvate/2-oxoglutarate dehydrogenase complex dihydrolipoamide dehydrogenase (E3) component